MCLSPVDDGAYVLCFFLPFDLVRVSSWTAVFSLVLFLCGHVCLAGSTSPSQPSCVCKEPLGKTTRPRHAWSGKHLSRGSACSSWWALGRRPRVRHTALLPSDRLTRGAPWRLGRPVTAPLVRLPKLAANQRAMTACRQGAVGGTAPPAGCRCRRCYCHRHPIGPYGPPPRPWWPRSTVNIRLYALQLYVTCYC